MGIFDWFTRKSKVTGLDDKIWLTTEAKLRGVCNDIADSLRQGMPVLVVAHFRQSFEQVRQLLAETELELVVCEERLTSTDVFRRGENSRHAPVVLALSDAFGTQPAETVDREADAPSIIVVERHPLPAPDRAVESFADSLGCSCQVTFHLSLDDPVARIFAGKWIKQTLQRLGMTETEAISSRMVAKRFQAVQKKIEKGAVGDQQAGSAEQWLRLNCPDLPRDES